MEKREMEATWEHFCQTGKIDDYLNYRNSVEEHKDNGTVSSSDRDGAIHHAHIGL